MLRQPYDGQLVPMFSMKLPRTLVPPVLALVGTGTGTCVWVWHWFVTPHEIFAGPAIVALGTGIMLLFALSIRRYLSSRPLRSASAILASAAIGALYFLLMATYHRFAGLYISVGRDLRPSALGVVAVSWLPLSIAMVTLSNVSKTSARWTAITCCAVGLIGLCILGATAGARVDRLPAGGWALVFVQKSTGGRSLMWAGDVYRVEYDRSGDGEIDCWSVAFPCRQRWHTSIRDGDEMFSCDLWDCDCASLRPDFKQRATMDTLDDAEALLGTTLHGEDLARAEKTVAALKSAAAENRLGFGGVVLLKSTVVEARSKGTVTEKDALNVWRIAEEWRLAVGGTGT